MTEFKTIAKVGDIPEGKGQAYAVNGRMVAVFCEEGEHFAIDDFCPHMGASLAGGLVEDGTVACPWHMWRFCIRKGTWLDNPKIGIDSFELRVQDSEIQVRVPPPQPRSERDDDNNSSGKNSSELGSKCDNCGDTTQ
jgi:nitrite reductase (NADH) small subunit